jgi:hypothetical protein
MRGVGEGADIIAGESPEAGQLAEDPNDSADAANAYWILWNVRARSWTGIARLDGEGSCILAMFRLRWLLKDLQPCEERLDHPPYLPGRRNSD